MNQGLGPVVGNRFDDERTTKLKPHLMERLVALTVRAVPLGTLVTEDDGRMAFVPNYTHSTERAAPKVQPAEAGSQCAFKPGDKVRVVATLEQLAKEWIDGRAAAELVAGLVGVVVPKCAGSAFDVCARLQHSGADGTLVWGFRHGMLALAEAETPTFDPMTEPLQIGDYVKVVFQGLADSGKQGQIIKLADDDGRANVCLRYDDGTEEERGWANRSSLKLLARKATPA